MSIMILLLSFYEFVNLVRIRFGLRLDYKLNNVNYRCVIGDATIRELGSFLSTWRTEAGGLKPEDGDQMTDVRGRPG